jgi:tyrosine-protein phosphatase SIW14
VQGEGETRGLETRVVGGWSAAAAVVLALAALCVSAPAGAQESSGKAGTQGAQKPAAGQAWQGAPEEEESYADLPNFHRVSAHLYRGGQPREGGLAKLAAMGVKTVLNLRDDDGRAAGEAREAAALGLRYFNVPVSRAGRPSRERIEELMALVDAPENQPVFVHCKRGADRTGAFVAAYRITHDGWTSERALAEAERYGMGFWQRGKKDFINDFYRDRGAPERLTDTQTRASH